MSDPVIGYVSPIGAQLVAQRIVAQRACNRMLFDVRCSTVREHDAAQVVRDAATRAASAK